MEITLLSLDPWVGLMCMILLSSPSLVCVVERKRTGSVNLLMFTEAMVNLLQQSVCPTAAAAAAACPPLCSPERCWDGSWLAELLPGAEEKRSDSYLPWKRERGRPCWMVQPHTACLCLCVCISLFFSHTYLSFKLLLSSSLSLPLSFSAEESFLSGFNSPSNLIWL